MQRVTIDLVTGRAVTAPGVAQEIDGLDLKRSAYAGVEVVFSREGAVVELANDATGIFGLKEPGKYDAPDFVTGALAWIKTGTGAATVYTFIFSLINTDLNALFLVDANEENDVETVTLMGEIEWISGGVENRTQTLAVRIQNNVIRGEEGVPTLPPILYGVFLPSITGLTGGAATDLDYLPTAGLQLGYVVQLLIPAGAPEELQWLAFVLEAGAASGANEVEPLDYDAGTNDRHWRGALGPVGGSGTNGAGYLATSATSLAVGAGGKAFSTQAGLAYAVGEIVRATSAANSTNWMQGVITAYSGSTLTVSVTASNGAGTYADWNLHVAPGLDGAPGANAYLESVDLPATDPDIDVDWALAATRINFYLVEDTIFTHINLVDGKTLTIPVTQDVSTVCAADWVGVTNWVGGVQPEPPALGATNLYIFVCIGAEVHGYLAGAGAAAPAPVGGYGFLSSGDVGGPTYAWVDATDGTALETADLATGTSDDGRWTIPITGWTFPVYDALASAVEVSTNGLIGLEPTSFAALYPEGAGSVTFPTADIDNGGVLIGVCAFDQEMATGTLYYKQLTGPNRLVISWVGIKDAIVGAVAASYQAILGADGSILLQYQTLDLVTDIRGMVGLQRTDSDGLDVSPYVTDGSGLLANSLAILITR